MGNWYGLVNVKVINLSLLQTSVYPTELGLCTKTIMHEDFLLCIFDFKAVQEDTCIM